MHDQCPGPDGTSCNKGHFLCFYGSMGFRYFVNQYVLIPMQDKQYHGHGTTDGTFRSERYFASEDKCGLFVALDKLSVVPKGNTPEGPPHGGQSYARAASHRTPASDRSYPQESGGPSGNTRERIQATTKQPSAQELEQLKQAVPDQSVDIDSQRVALQAFERKNNEMKVGKRPSLPSDEANCK